MPHFPYRDAAISGAAAELEKQNAGRISQPGSHIGFHTPLKANETSCGHEGVTSNYGSGGDGSAKDDSPGDKPTYAPDWSFVTERFIRTRVKQMGPSVAI